LIVRCGKSFFLNQIMRPTHLSDWQKESSSRRQHPGCSRLRITELKKDSPPFKIDGKS
jgi:hypothetical protein